MSDVRVMRTKAKHYEAFGRDAGVVVYRCPHRHKTAAAASRCGERSFVSFEKGQRLEDSRWWNGGVRGIDANDNPVAFSDGDE